LWRSPPSSTHADAPPEPTRQRRCLCLSSFQDGLAARSSPARRTPEGTVMIKTHDLRIRGFQPLPSPVELRERLPLSTEVEGLVTSSRREIEAILSGEDDRLLVVVGPCSVHDPAAAAEYARRLVVEAERHAEHLLIVMRVYFEKPRTVAGWKGLINDPYLDGTHRVAEGLELARGVLRDITALGLPVGCEFLEPISPH